MRSRRLAAARRASSLGRHDGFTLVEVLFGVAMVSMILAGIITLFQAALLDYRLANETTKSTLLAQQKLEQLMSLAVGSTELIPGTYSESYVEGLLKRTTVITYSATTRLRTIYVTVRRTSVSGGDSARHVQLIAMRIE